MYKKYLDAINKTNDVIQKLNGSDEISRISKSEIKWALSKMGIKQRRHVKKVKYINLILVKTLFLKCHTNIEGSSSE